MKYISIIGFVSLFVLAFFILSWLLSKLADGDISRIFLWNKYVYLIITPISFLMWLFEAIKFGTWLDPKNNFYIVLSVINAFYILMVLMVWFANSKSKTKNKVTTLHYGIHYHKTRTNFVSEYAQSRTMMMLVLSLVANPILNIVFIVIFVSCNLK